VNILLAVDNSSHSHVAVDVVLNRMWPAGSVFKVFCAVERREPVFAVMNPKEAEGFQNKALAAAKQFTLDIARRIESKFPDCRAINEATSGDSKELILEQVTWPADLIVVGSHGRHGLPRIFLGSVSQTVLLYSPCSTLIARYQKSHEGVPEFDRNILVAVDDTTHSRNVLDWVLSMPWPEGAQFTLLTVLPAIVDKYSDGIDALYASKFSGERLELKQATQIFGPKR
jgi:nucleotide-binding universal stress UspA family protein